MLRRPPDDPSGAPPLQDRPAIQVSYLSTRHRGAGQVDVALVGFARSFVERTRVALTELMSRRLDDVRLAVMMIDGIDLGGRTNVVAPGITIEGVKIPLGLWEGSTENAAVAAALLSDLVARGLDPERGILFVIDGHKTLRKAIRTIFDQAPVQRCSTPVTVLISGSRPR